MGEVIYTLVATMLSGGTMSVPAGTAMDCVGLKRDLIASPYVLEADCRPVSGQRIDRGHFVDLKSESAPNRNPVPSN